MKAEDAAPDETHTSDAPSDDSRVRGTGPSRELRVRLKDHEVRRVEGAAVGHPQGKSGVVRDALRGAGVL